LYHKVLFKYQAGIHILDKYYLFHLPRVDFSLQELNNTMELLDKVKVVLVIRECSHPTDPARFLYLSMHFRERMYFPRDLINQNAYTT
jgi:hypothetical protein